MKNTISSMNNKTLIIFCLFSLQILKPVLGQSGKAMTDPYVCIPCGNDCDKETFDKPGDCMHCHMKLVLKSSIRFKNISPAALCEIVAKKPGTVLLDVRTPEEFNGTADVNYGRLKGAINIPIQELESRMSELKKYKNKDIIVYCSHSHRSPQASYILTQNRFSHITNMQGGMSVWQDAVKDNNCTEKLLVK
jgi:rhodanese-related sulfurtransferase/DNA-directed RNA polymerase subunit RPC12/RpoP